MDDELPPSYESVVSCGKPPPYHTTIVFDEKLDPSGAHAAAVLKQATGWTDCCYGRLTELLWKESSGEESNVYLNTNRRPMLTSLESHHHIMWPMQEPTLSQVVVWSCSLACTSHCSYLHVVRIDEVLLCTRIGAIFRHLEKWNVGTPFIIFSTNWVAKFNLRAVERLVQVRFGLLKIEVKEGKNNPIYSFFFISEMSF